MTKHAATLLDRALSLSEKDRAAIAHRLIRSLDGLEPDAAEQALIDAAWAEEVTRRDREIDEGRVALIDGDAVLRKLRRG